MYRKYVRKSTGKSASPTKKTTHKYGMRNSPNSALRLTPGLKAIGKGAYGNIFSGYNTGGRRIAIKKTANAVDRECTLHKRAYAVVPNHVVQLYSCSAKEMVLEYFHGGTLKSFIKKHKATLTDDDIRNFILQIVCTLKLLHKKLPSFRHHDTHLDNILVDDTMPPGTERIDAFAIPSNGIRLALSDFGLATNSNTTGSEPHKNTYGISKTSDITYDVHYYLAALADEVVHVRGAPLANMFFKKILKGYAKATNVHTRKFRLIYGHAFIPYEKILADPFFNKYRVTTTAKKNTYINFGKGSPKKKVVTVKRLSPVTGKWTKKNINMRNNLKLLYSGNNVAAYVKATKLVNRVVAKKPLIRRLVKRKVAAIRAKKAAAAGPSRARALNLKAFLSKFDAERMRPRNIENYIRTGYSTPVAKNVTKAIVNKLVANRSGISSPGVDEAWKKVQNVMGTSFGGITITGPGSAGAAATSRDVKAITESKLDAMRRAGYFIVDAREKSSSSYRALNPYYPIGLTFKGYTTKSLMGLWNAIKFIPGKGTNKTRMGMNTGVRRVGKVEYYLFNGKKLSESEALTSVFIPAYKMLLDTKFKKAISDIRTHPKIAILCENKTAVSILKEYLS